MKKGSPADSRLAFAVAMCALLFLSFPILHLLPSAGGLLKRDGSTLGESGRVDTSESGVDETISGNIAKSPTTGTGRRQHKGGTTGKGPGVEGLRTRGRAMG